MNNISKNIKQQKKYFILLMVLIVSNLFTTKLAAIDQALSSEVNDPKISCYFRRAPRSKEFKSWRNKVLTITESYKLKQYLGDWLADTEALEKFIEYLEVIDEDNIDMSWIIDNSQGLVSIGSLSPSKCINVNPVIAVIDELYREMLRLWGNLYFSRCKKLFDLCFWLSKRELGEDHKLVKQLSNSPLNGFTGSIINWWTNEYSSNSTSDIKLKKIA